MELVVVVSPKERDGHGLEALGATASETRLAPHTPSAPPIPLGAARAALPRAARDLVDIGVVG